MATTSESPARHHVLPVPDCFVVAWPHYEADLDQPFQEVIQWLPNRKHLTEFWCLLGSRVGAAGDGGVGRLWGGPGGVGLGCEQVWGS